MSRQITFTLVADGGTDRALIPILVWALHRLDPDIDILEPEFQKRKGAVSEFLSTLRTHTMLIFVHRDAETISLEERRKEFREVVQHNMVPVIPVRMTEAWLLIEARAIAIAADCPEALVEVPHLRTLESIVDPKERLHDLLRQAAGNPTGRRRKIFERSLVQRRMDVAARISDYSVLENLSAFKEFQNALASAYPYPRP